VANPQAPAVCVKCGQTFTIAPAAPAAQASSAKTVAGIGLGVVLVVCLFGCLGFMGILAAIAVPNFIKYKGRAKQSEAKANLKMLFTAEKGYFEQNGRYTTNLAALEMPLATGNRYAYFADASGPMQDRSGGAAVAEYRAVGVDGHRHPEQARVTQAELAGLPVRPGISGECPRCEITLVAAANLDSDPTLDVWSISSAERRDARGGVILAGQPYNEVDDLRE
jgi:type IV pilus assembly protein PilA